MPNNPIDSIEILGAAEHNLKRINLTLPKRKLIVFSGVSGSGKSSLAFDTIYAEGRRRYVESLSAYARQFLGQLEKPRYEAIRGLAPTIAIEQKKATSNPRSTVGTVTEIHDYLRLLYARCGDQHCHSCGLPAGRTTPQEIVDSILSKYLGQRITLLAPVVSSRKGEMKDVVAAIQAQGFTRVRLNGEVVKIEGLAINPKQRNNIDVVIDRLAAAEENRTRLTESVESALRVGENWLKVLHDSGEAAFSTEHACVNCGIGLPEPSPQLFSFNSPIGMCRACEGIGIKLEVDIDKLIPDPTLSIAQGAITLWSSVMEVNSMTRSYITGLAHALNFDLKTPWRDLPEHVKETILYGSKSRTRISVSSPRGSWVSNRPIEGVVNRINRLFRDTGSNESRYYYLRFMSEKKCPECSGSRLRAEARSFRLAGVTIDALAAMTVSDAHRFFDTLKLEGNKEVIGREIIKEIRSRLAFLLNVGLDYLTLDRTSATLSGGEAQRIRLASQLGSELSGVIYVLDEPSIGMHARDTNRLLDTLCKLRDLGNTVIVVEHDRETIERADWVVEFGPWAGVLGGVVTFEGPPAQLAISETITGKYLSGRRMIHAPLTRRNGNSPALKLKGCSKNNLRNIDVVFPLGRLIAVTGVSGAGKSSLVNYCLLKGLQNALAGKSPSVGGLASIEGHENIDKVIAIDQEPIGRTPRSNPATYTKVFDAIREVYANTRESKIRGYKPGRFSFNVNGGRCEACQGNGYIKVEMHFLPDVYVPCEVCKGKRFNRETLQVRYKGLNIAELLDLTIDEAIGLFEPYRGILRILKTLERVGLGYIQLGQPSTTLSGGEAQRIKLSKELARPATGKTLYVLDEPTTGLHFENIRMLVEVLQELVNRGNTVVVIEHNLDVIKCADWIIDLGPEGGMGGGSVVATGTPEEVSRIQGSWTGFHLRDVLGS
ncbi:MAG: excinuclease ABC subunit UvrA [Planctomycetota bacterium]